MITMHQKLLILFGYFVAAVYVAGIIIFLLKS